MFVTEIIQSGLTENVSNWEQIVQSILALDAHLISDLILASNDVQQMTIGGGNGKYTIGATFDGHIYYEYFNPVASDANIAIVVGNQRVICLERELADLKTTLKIAKRFSEEGVLDPENPWRKYGGLQ